MLYEVITLTISEDDGVDKKAIYSELMMNNKLGRITHYPTMNGMNDVVIRHGFYQVQVTKEITATEMARITSYNVCYTKLLRSHQNHEDSDDTPP